MGGRPTDAELIAALRELAAAAARAPVRALRRRPSAYRTSFPLEELVLELEDGTSARLAFKRLGWEELGQGARLAKPKFLHDPGREAAVYASVLAPAGLGAPRYWGSVNEPERRRHWLFVEWV